MFLSRRLSIEATVTIQKAEPLLQGAIRKVAVLTCLCLRLRQCPRDEQDMGISYSDWCKQNQWHKKNWTQSIWPVYC